VVTRPVYELKAELFKTLGHPARIRILEVLRDGEANVADIADAVGVSGSTLSQHLATLRRADVISSRRDGSQVIYQVVDPRVFQLLLIGREILTTTLEGSRELLNDLAQLRLDEDQHRSTVD
jgi:DNA-binding transcriptional ArsR family regulator